MQKSLLPPAYRLLFALLLAALWWPAAQAQTEACGTPPAPSEIVNPNNYPNPSTFCQEIVNLRVNIHFMLRSDGTGNFREGDDGRPGNPSTSVTGYDYAAGLIWAANGHWDNNPQLTIAPGSSLTPQPKRIHLLLTGVYFHRDDAMRDYHVYNTPGYHLIEEANTINIFLMEDEVDADGNIIHTANGGHAPQVSSCGNTSNGMWTCIKSPWSKYITYNHQSWQFAGILNHEIGHLLGLNHTWQGASGCGDAPANANCWDQNASNPSCDAPSKVSNNLMDYNNAMAALSPCQLDIIHRNLANCLRPYVYSCSTCLPTYLNYTITNPKIRTPSNVILDGRSTFGESWFSVEIDEVDSNNAIIAGTHYGNTFWREMGIENLSSIYTFVSGRRYRIHVSAGASSCSATGTRTTFARIL